MSHWQRTDVQRESAWSAVEALGADVALLQETSPPASRSNLVYREIGGRRRWGSAVVGITADVRAIETVVPRASHGPVGLDHAVPGAVAVAEVPTGIGPLAVVSIYGLIENGYAVTTVNGQLSDLTSLFDAHLRSVTFRWGCEVPIVGPTTGSGSAFVFIDEAAEDRSADYPCVLGIIGLLVGSWRSQSGPVQPWPRVGSTQHREFVAQH